MLTPGREPRRRDQPPHRLARRVLGRLLASSLLAAVAALGVALLGLPLLTHSVPLTVLTGSMRPTYPPGTVVVVRPVRPAHLRVGQTVTFMARADRPEVVTHRIVRISFTPDGHRRFTTRGDANGADDPQPVSEGQVRGTVWYAVPLVGRVLEAPTPALRSWLVRGSGALLLLRATYLLAVGVRERRRRTTPRAPVGG